MAAPDVARVPRSPTQCRPRCRKPSRRCGRPRGTASYAGLILVTMWGGPGQNRASASPSGAGGIGALGRTPWSSPTWGWMSDPLQEIADLEAEIDALARRRALPKGDRVLEAGERRGMPAACPDPVRPDPARTDGADPGDHVRAR